MNLQTLLLARRLALWGVAALLTACAHHPLPVPERPALPAQWLHAAAVAAPGADGTGTIAPDPAWWRQYREPALDAAVAQALAHHGDVRAAALKLRNADLRAQAAGAALHPTPSGSLGASVSRPLSSPDDGSPLHSSRSFSSTWSVAWEIDLWGKLATQADMARLEREATAWDGQATAAALAASVVRQYWQLAALGQRLTVAGQSLANARRTFELTQAQYDAGAISGLDLAQARQSLQLQELTLVTLNQQRSEARHALSLLLDAVPGYLPAGIDPQRLPAGAAARAVLRPGVPAQLLARRPDLAAAEWRLRASLGNVQAQRLAFYPAFSLTGALGTGSSTLLHILSNPVATLGAGLTLPFLNLGEMRRNPQIAQNEYEQAVIGFRQSLLRAYGEVENALSAVATLRETVRRQAELVAQARHIEELTEVRYRAGAVALRQWLDMQEARRQAELAEVDAQLSLLLAQAQLYQALGWAAGPAPAQEPAFDEALSGAHRW